MIQQLQQGAKSLRMTTRTQTLSLTVLMRLAVTLLRKYQIRSLLQGRQHQRLKLPMVMNECAQNSRRERSKHVSHFTSRLSSYLVFSSRVLHNILVDSKVPKALLLGGSIPPLERPRALLASRLTLLMPIYTHIECTLLSQCRRESKRLRDFAETSLLEIIILHE